MENLFELKHVSCFFGKNDTVTKALEEVNLDILKEECISIIGPSGAGKSTLLNVLAGIIKPTTGVVLYKGKPMPDSISKRANIRLNEFGFIFQSYNLIPTLNVRDNIILPVVMNNEKVDLALYEKLISEINLSGHEKKKPNQLSGGLAQRVSIARALIKKPTVVFADEPTGNLDSVNGNAVFSLLFELAEKYRYTLIYVTHDKEKSNLAKRIITIKDGKLIES